MAERLSHLSYAEETKIREREKKAAVAFYRLNGFLWLSAA